MTCIVGLVDHECVYLGADAAGAAGLHVTTRRDPKVYRNGPYLLGFTSSFRMGQLLHHAFKAPVPKGEVDLDAFLVTTFVDAVRQCLKDGGMAKKTNEEERGGNFLVAYQNQLWEIESDYQVGRPTAPYAAIGCGWELALGSLYTTGAYGLEDARERVAIALEAAEAYSGGVRGPFTILHT